MEKPRLERVDDWRWRLPRQGGMRVDGLVYASARMAEDLRADASLEQVRNVAHLPGIVGASLAMPDIHWGYGFPIGGVAAMDAEDGVVSPGGVGYDINCGVRLLRSTSERERGAAAAARAGDRSSSATCPTGRRRRAAATSSSTAPICAGCSSDGARWAVRAGNGHARRPRGARGERLPGGGRSRRRSPNAPSSAAPAQLGTLGSGNHFAEIQWVDEIYDAAAAAAFGLRLAQVTVMIHSGSRGLGHQVCDDFLETMLDAAERHRIELARSPAVLRSAALAARAAATSRRWRRRRTSLSPTGR